MGMVPRLRTKVSLKVRSAFEECLACQIKVDNYISEPYLSLTCSVPSPGILHSEVLLAGECTEQVGLRYGSGILFLFLKDTIIYYENFL